MTDDNWIARRGFLFHFPALLRNKNIVDHEYEIERDGDTIAKVSKKWFRMRDTCGVGVDDLADAPLVLAVTVAVDALAHD